MAGNVYTWSTTAATNASADSDINFAEGQTPGSVNDSARGLMAGVAGILKDNNASITTGGSANAYTATSNIAIAALATGLKLILKANFSNTGACTLNLTPSGGAAFGAKAIRVVDSGADRALLDGEIQNNGIYLFNYDAAANSAAGAWILLNPSRPGPKLLSTGTFSAVSTLDFVLTTYTSFRALQFLLTNVTSSATNTIQARTSTNGGSTYDSGAGNYSWAQAFVSSSTGAGSSNSNSDTSIQVCYGSTTAGDNLELLVTLYNQAGTANFTGLNAVSVTRYTGITFINNNAGNRLSSADVDAIRFLPSTGTFSGSYAVYGIQ